MGKLDTDMRIDGIWLIKSLSLGGRSDTVIQFLSYLNITSTQNNVRPVTGNYIQLDQRDIRECSPTNLNSFT